MIRKYYNHTLHNDSRYGEEELKNTKSQKISGRQLKQSNQLSPPRQENYKTRKVTNNA